jgi:hypothetical protein
VNSAKCLFKALHRSYHPNTKAIKGGDGKGDLFLSQIHYQKQIKYHLSV